MRIVALAEILMNGLNATKFAVLNFAVFFFSIPEQFLFLGYLYHETLEYECISWDTLKVVGLP